MKGIPEDASLLAKTLYKYGTSKSPIKRGISKSVINLIEATGSKERTAKKKENEKSIEREALMKFLNSKTTQNALEKLGVNSRTFNVAVFRGYPFDTKKYEIFVRAFIVLRNELRENFEKNMKLSPSKYPEIIQNMLKYQAGDKLTTHLDYIPMVISSEDDSVEYSAESDELEELARKSESLADTSSLFKKGILRSVEDVEDRSSGLSYYNSYLDFLNDIEDNIEDKDTLASKRNSVMRSIDSGMDKLQVGGFCYNEAKKLKGILKN